MCKTFKFVDFETLKISERNGTIWNAWERSGTFRNVTLLLGMDGIGLHRLDSYNMCEFMWRQRVRNRDAFNEIMTNIRT